MSRLDQYSVTANLDGVNLGVFDKQTGGDISSSEQKYRPGGLEGEIALGGFKQVTNVVIERLYDFKRDHPLAPALIAASGRGKMTVAKQPLDLDGNPFGQPIVYTGILKGFNLPSPDSMSSAAGTFTLELSTAAIVG